MIKKIAILFVAIFSFLSSQAQLSYYLSNKFWRLKYATINGKEYSFNEQNSNAPTLQFSGGNIRGNGGCNAYHTRFTINGTSLDINPVMSTRMSCSDLYLNETEYFQALASSHTLYYDEGSSEFKLINVNNDVLIFFAQFSRSPGSYSPPRREVVQESGEIEFPRKHSARTKKASLSKKELARQKLLEKKMNSKKGKLTKKEKRELMALQSKEKKISKSSKEPKAPKGKKSKKASKEEAKSKKGKTKNTKGKKEETKKLKSKGKETKKKKKK